MFQVKSKWGSGGGHEKPAREARREKNGGVWQIWGEICPGEGTCGGADFLGGGDLPTSFLELTPLFIALRSVLFRFARYLFSWCRRVWCIIPSSAIDLHRISYSPHRSATWAQAVLQPSLRIAATADIALHSRFRFSHGPFCLAYS